MIRLGLITLHHLITTDQFSDVVLKTLIAAEGHIVQQVHKHCASQGNCFELFGFDIMLDRTGSVILLEVNVSPSLHSNSKLDQDIKGNLIADVFNTTGVLKISPLDGARDQLSTQNLLSSAIEKIPSAIVKSMI